MVQKIEKICRVFSGVIFFILITFLIYLQLSNPNMDFDRNVVDLSHVWVDENNMPFSLNAFSYESSNEQNPQNISYTLINHEKDQVIIFYCRNLYTNIYINDELVLEDVKVTNSFFGYSPGIRWHIVHIPSSEQPITIRLENSSAYTNTNGLINSIYMGELEQVYSKVISIYMGSFLISLSLLLAGTILLVVFFYRRLKFHNGNDFAYLGAATLFASLWSCCESALFQLFWGNSEFFHLMSYLTLIAVPPAFSLIAIYRLEGEKKTIAMYYNLIACLNVIVTSFLHFSGICEYHYTLTSSHLLLYAYIPICFVLVRSYHKNEHTRLTSILGAVFTVFFMLSAFARYQNGYYTDFSDYFRICIIGVLFVLITYHLSLVIQMVRNGTKADMLHNLAITDYLTGLYNRTAFEEHRNQYIDAATGYVTVGVIQFDINNLKKMNDTLGHEKGDLLIKLASENIKTAFADKGNCYRMGGDEFLVVLTSKNPYDDYQEGILSLQSYCQECFEHNLISFPIEIAHGFQDKQDISLDEALRLADAKMYEHKKSTKQ